MIIDFHTHCFPDNLAKRAIPILAEKGNVRPYTDGTISGLKYSMETSGVPISVIQSIATKPQQTSTINRWVANITDNSLIKFGTIHPDYIYWKEEIAWLADHGFKGVKFHPEYQHFYVDDEKVFLIYEEIFSQGLIALFHSGFDMAYPDQCHCTPARLKKVINKFNGAAVVAAHMGGYRYWPGVQEFFVGSDIYFDTSFSYKELGKNGMEQIIKDHGAEKILFGSDSPWGSQAEEISNIKSMDLGDEHIEAILENNAKRLLDI